MTPWFATFRLELRAHRGRLAVLTLCALLTAVVCCVAFHALWYTRTEVRPWLASIFPPQRIIVRAGQVDFAFLKFEVGGLTESRRADVAALPGVERVFAQVPAQFPVSAHVSMSRLDFSLETDIVLHGVPEELIAAELPGNTSFDWDPQSNEPVPAVVSAYFLDMYNLGIAEGSSLPKLSKAAAIGREFTIILGESTLGLSTKAKPRTVRARVVGLTANPLLVGVSVPADAMKAWNREFKGSGEETYSALHVDVGDPRDVEDVTRAITAMHLQAQPAGENLRTLRQAVGAAEGVALGVVVAVLLLAVVGVFSTVLAGVGERRALWGVQRATGMSRVMLLSFVVAESAIAGLLPALLGCGVAWVLLLNVNNFFGAELSGMMLVPGEPFMLAPVAALATVGVVWVLVLAPGLAAALPSCRAEPADLLRQQAL
ncbi:MAG: putative transport system permease protein [Candidatus Sumerlaeota bacterium]|nr:putative transport system permease protein [Candidatus Sumerlaeota bacterium]